MYTNPKVVCHVGWHKTIFCDRYKQNKPSEQETMYEQIYNEVGWKTFVIADLLVVFLGFTVIHLWSCDHIHFFLLKVTSPSNVTKDLLSGKIGEDF